MSRAAGTTPPTRSRAREATQAKRKERFLKELAKRANVSAAAKAAKVDRSTPYHWRETDPEFAAAWDEAVEVAVLIWRKPVVRIFQNLIRLYSWYQS